VTAMSDRWLRAVHLAVPAGLLLAQFVLPPFHHGMLTRIMVLSAYTVGYNVLLGYTGLMSLGHAMFFATGMYATGLVVYYLHWGVIPAMLAGLGASIVVPVVIGVITLRTTGVSFLIVTMMFAQAFFLATLAQLFGRSVEASGFAALIGRQFDIVIKPPKGRPSENDKVGPDKAQPFHLPNGGVVIGRTSPIASVLFQERDGPPLRIKCVSERRLVDENDGGFRRDKRFYVLCRTAESVDPCRHRIFLEHPPDHRKTFSGNPDVSQQMFAVTYQPFRQIDAASRSLPHVQRRPEHGRQVGMRHSPCGEYSLSRLQRPPPCNVFIGIACNLWPHAVFVIPLKEENFGYFTEFPVESQFRQ